MFMLQTLTVVSLAVIFLTSVEGRTPLFFKYLRVLCLAWIACTLQVDRVETKRWRTQKKKEERKRHGSSKDLGMDVNRSKRRQDEHLKIIHMQRDMLASF